LLIRRLTHRHLARISLGRNISKIDARKFFLLKSMVIWKKRHPCVSVIYKFSAISAGDRKAGRSRDYADSSVKGRLVERLPALLTGTPIRPKNTKSSDAPNVAWAFTASRSAARRAVSRVVNAFPA
jgi:hypothetical protein